MSLSAQKYLQIPTSRITDSRIRYSNVKLIRDSDGHCTGSRTARVIGTRMPSVSGDSDGMDSDGPRTRDSDAPHIRDSDAVCIRDSDYDARVYGTRMSCVSGTRMPGPSTRDSDGELRIRDSEALRIYMGLVCPTYQGLGYQATAY